MYPAREARDRGASPVLQAATGAGSVCSSLPASSCHALHVVAGHQPLNLIENGEGIEGAQLGLEAIRGCSQTA